MDFMSRKQAAKPALFWRTSFSPRARLVIAWLHSIWDWLCLELVISDLRPILKHAKGNFGTTSHSNRSEEQLDTFVVPSFGILLTFFTFFKREKFARVSLGVKLRLKETKDCQKISYFKEHI